MPGITVSDADFQSVALAGMDAPRRSDGSLPSLPKFHLAANSDLIDKGTDVRLPYAGSDPYLGCFETGLPAAGGLTRRRDADDSRRAFVEWYLHASRARRCGFERAPRSVEQSGPSGELLLDPCPPLTCLEKWRKDVGASAKQRRGRPATKYEPSSSATIASTQAPFAS